MRKTIEVIYCDRCGKEIEGDMLYRVLPHTVARTGGQEELNEFQVEAKEKEFCYTCMTILIAPVLHPKKTRPRTVKPAADPAQEKPKKKQERVTGTRKVPEAPLDTGKIYALRNAGWSWEKIQEELRTDEDIETIKELYTKEAEKREAKKGKKTPAADPYDYMDYLDPDADDLDI